MSIKWGLSVLDWRDHAINESQDHPIGVLKAKRGLSATNPHVTGPPSAGSQGRLTG